MHGAVLHIRHWHRGAKVERYNFSFASYEWCNFSRIVALTDKWRRMSNADG